MNTTLLVMIVAIGAIVIMGIVQIVMELNYRDDTVLARYFLNVAQYGTMMLMLMYSRFNAVIETNKTLWLAFYIIIFLFAIIDIFFKRSSIKDIVTELFVALCFVPFFLYDFWDIHILNFFSDTSKANVCFENGSWSLTLIDWLLLINLLFNPIIDNIYSLIDELDNNIPRILGRTFSAISFLLIVVSLHATRRFEYGKIGALCLLLFYTYFIIRSLMNFIAGMKVGEMIAQVVYTGIFVIMFIVDIIGIEGTALWSIANSPFVIAILNASAGKIISPFIPEIAPIITGFISDRTTKIILPVEEAPVALIEEIPRRRPGRPKGSKDSYQRHRRTKAEIEAARAAEAESD